MISPRPLSTVPRKQKQKQHAGAGLLRHIVQRAAVRRPLRPFRRPF
jgi:hypothetical protein